MIKEGRKMSRFLKNQSQTINHFSIRKLTIGVASVLLSTTLYFGLNMEGQLNTQAAEINQESEKTSRENIKSSIPDNSKVNVNDSLDTSQNETKLQKVEGSQQKQIIQKEVPSTNFSENQSNNFNEVKSKDNSKIEDVSSIKPSVTTVYPDANKNSVSQSNWFNVQVSSGTLTNVRKGTTYQIKVGNANLMNYDPDAISIPEFNVINYGNGLFDVKANNDYTKANFTISASMQYKKQIEKDESIIIPVEISKDGKNIYDTTTSVNLTPALQLSYEETHPLLKYKCYGRIPGTDKIAWGVYINYNGQELKDLDISATFKNQTLILKSIMAYTPSEEEIKAEGINQNTYPDSTYNYDISKEVQNQSGIAPVSKLQFNKKGSLIIDGSNYSKQPIYLYFQTQLENGQEEPTSTFTLNAAGVPTAMETTGPSSNGNSGSGNGISAVSENKTITETINYLYQGTDKVAAPQYQAVPITFTREGEKDAVTGAVNWGAWTPAQSFKAVTSPTIKGYTADKASIAAQEVNADSKDLVFNVYYNRDSNPTVPTEPIDPHNPSIPEITLDNGSHSEKISNTKQIKIKEKEAKKQNQIIPFKSSHIEKNKFNGRNKIVFPKGITRSTRISSKEKFTHLNQVTKLMDKQRKQSKLPQTGVESSLVASLLGGISVGLGLFGLGIKRRN